MTRAAKEVAVTVLVVFSIIFSLYAIQQAFAAVHANADPQITFGQGARIICDAIDKDATPQGVINAAAAAEALWGKDNAGQAMKLAMNGVCPEYMHLAIQAAAEHADQMPNGTPATAKPKPPVSAGVGGALY